MLPGHVMDVIRGGLEPRRWRSAHLPFCSRSRLSADAIRRRLELRVLLDRPRVAVTGKGRQHAVIGAERLEARRDRGPKHRSVGFRAGRAESFRRLDPMEHVLQGRASSQDPERPLHARPRAAERLGDVRDRLAGLVHAARPGARISVEAWATSDVSAPAAGRGDPVAHTLADPGSLELGHEPKHGEERLPPTGLARSRPSRRDTSSTLRSCSSPAMARRFATSRPSRSRAATATAWTSPARTARSIASSAGRRAPGLGARDALVHVLDRALPMRGWIRGANSARILHFDRIRSAQIKDG